MKKIKEEYEFAKMFRVSIPVKEHFEYYIQTLSKSFEFKDIVSKVNDFADFEEWLSKNDYCNVGQYKMGYVLPLLKKYIENTDAYKICQEQDYSDFKFYQKNNWKLYEGSYMLSMDLSSANFQALKLFDEKDELKLNWDYLCNSLSIHPVVTSSKGFRQVVFGNLNPKRLQKIQHRYIINICNAIETIIPSDNVLCLSSDEIIFNLSDIEVVAQERYYQIKAILDAIKKERLLKNEKWLDIHMNVFKMEKISKDVYLKTICHVNEDKIFNTYKTLYGCPQNMYYINFKEYVVEEGISDIDCLFTLDNKVAKWII